ncbi:hypothetical protein PHYC_03539 [Phycisphaerales bacterium]|nr:hypothetical protein PHYC_03539 [Phycisphaerales bacterium]
MFAKSAVLIVTVGACGCALLALRQQRLQVASELARTQLRISRADERLWTLRTTIAERTAPRNIERMARDLGPLVPIIDNPSAAAPAIAKAPLPTPPREAPRQPQPRTDAAPDSRPPVRVARGTRP